jgi:hypothetical protein
MSAGIEVPDRPAGEMLSQPALVPDMKLAPLAGASAGRSVECGQP